MTLSNELRLIMLKSRVEALTEKASVMKGDTPGHEFRGNQYSGALNAAHDPADEYYRAQDFSSKGEYLNDLKQRAAETAIDAGARPEHAQQLAQQHATKVISAFQASPSSRAAMRSWGWSK